MPISKSRVEERGIEAHALVAPLSRTLQQIIDSGKSLSTNKDRLLNFHLKPKLLPNIPGPFDWFEFYIFCLQIFDYKDMRPQPHDELLQFIASLFPDLSFSNDGEGQNFGIALVPRNCFKTVIFSIALPLYLLWKNPNSRGMLSAHRHDASKAYLKAIKWHIENNQKFIELCGSWKPKAKLTKWSEEGIIISTRTKAFVDLSIDTAGVDRSKVGAHPDWIICDDLHSEKNVESATMRNKVYDHIVAFYPMLQPCGTLIVVGTRWHMADAYGKLLSMDDEAIASDYPAQYKRLIRSAYIEGTKPGEAKKLYFPERLSEAFLDNAKRIYKGKFSLWYLNKAIADSDKLFPREELKFVTISYLYDEDMGVPSMRVSDEEDFVPVNVTLAWDPSGINPTDTSDFHGISIVGCDPNNRWLIPTAEAIKAKPDQVLKRVSDYIVMYEPNCVIIENVGQSGTWAYMLRSYMEKIGHHCPPIMLFTPPNRVNKHSRISSSLQPKWADREIVIDRRCRELIDQFDNFPQLDYDDLLDSVHMHLDYTSPPVIDDQTLLYGNVLMTTVPKTANSDMRARMGSYAGMGSTNWGSLATLDDV